MLSLPYILILSILLHPVISSDLFDLVSLSVELSQFFHLPTSNTNRPIVVDHCGLCFHDQLHLPSIFTFAQPFGSSSCCTSLGLKSISHLSPSVQDFFYDSSDLFLTIANLTSIFYHINTFPSSDLDHVNNEYLLLQTHPLSSQISSFLFHHALDFPCLLSLTLDSFSLSSCHSEVLDSGTSFLGVLGLKLLHLVSSIPSFEEFIILELWNQLGSSISYIESNCDSGCLCDVYSDLRHLIDGFSPDITSIDGSIVLQMKFFSEI
ncbi:hypothetical protein GEMRC1_011898 [Eukaryota sp. GEM-RC1]